ncbi:MAG: hypothetical protein V1809_00055, partial [Planctomycetota bacterium]
MVTIEDARALLQKEYDRIWAGWYAGQVGVVPATLVVTEGDADAGYRPEANTILMPVASGNLEDIDWQMRGERYPHSPGMGWFIHQIELIHEMLHEYQHNVLFAATPEGIALGVAHQGRFFGPGHDERFFTAIVEKAGFFGLSGEEFA